MAGFPDQLVEPGDAAALSLVIERIVHWRRDDPGLGERSRNWVTAHMSIEATGESVHALLRRAVDAGRLQRRRSGTAGGDPDAERSRSWRELT
jgi:hypothetical protein